MSHFIPESLSLYTHILMYACMHVCIKSSQNFVFIQKLQLRYSKCCIYSILMHFSYLLCTENECLWISLTSKLFIYLTSLNSMSHFIPESISLSLSLSLYTHTLIHMYACMHACMYVSNQAKISYAFKNYNWDIQNVASTQFSCQELQYKSLV